MHALVAVLHAGLDQIFDQVCGHVERVIEVGDRIYIRTGQSLPEILFRDEKKRLQLFLSAECIDRHSLGCGYRGLRSRGLCLTERSGGLDRSLSGSPGSLCRIL